MMKEKSSNSHRGAVVAFVRDSLVVQNKRARLDEIAVTDKGHTVCHI
jgi:hypothetical protein